MCLSNPSLYSSAGDPIQVQIIKGKITLNRFQASIHHAMKCSYLSMHPRFVCIYRERVVPRPDSLLLKKGKCRFDRHSDGRDPNHNTNRIGNVGMSLIPTHQDGHESLPHQCRNKSNQKAANGIIVNQEIKDHVTHSCSGTREYNHASRSRGSNSWMDPYKEK
jgi:hypothetical protein